MASAAARPRSTAFGADAYPSIHLKAASLLHSIARNHPLVDGNNCLAQAATITFYGADCSDRGALRLRPGQPGRRALAARAGGRAARCEI